MEQYQVIYFGRGDRRMGRGKNPILEVMTTKEAAARWGKEHSSVKHLCTGVQGRPPRLTDEECRKSGGTWLITRAGMERVYGEEKNPE